MPEPTQIVTTPAIDGWRIRRYLGLVTAQVVAGTGFFSDFAAGVTDIFGGRSGTYQKQLASLQAEVVEQLRTKAAGMGANWVVGARIDFDEISGKNMQMFMVSAAGTAVIADAAEDNPELGIDRSVSSNDVEAGLARMALVEAAASGRLEFADHTWLPLARHGVVEAIPPLVVHLEDLAANHQSALPPVLQRATEFLRSLPPAGVQRCLHSQLLERPGARGLVTQLLIDLTLVDLRWVQAQLADDDLGLRRIALQLLRGNARLYSSADLRVLGGIIAALPAAFPERVKVIEKKSLFARAPEHYWVCECGQENIQGSTPCGSCLRDKRGFGRDDFTPEMAEEKLKRTMDYLQRAIAPNEHERLG